MNLVRLQINRQLFYLVDHVIHGSFGRWWLTGDDHAEKVANIPIRQWRVANHQRPLEHHAFLDFSCDLVQFVPPFLSLLLSLHTGWYVPVTNRKKKRIRNTDMNYEHRIEGIRRYTKEQRYLPKANVTTFVPGKYQTKSFPAFNSFEKVLDRGHGEFHGFAKSFGPSCFPHQPKFGSVDLRRKERHIQEMTIRIMDIINPEPLPFSHIANSYHRCPKIRHNVCPAGTNTALRRNSLRAERFYP